MLDETNKTPEIRQRAASSRNEEPRRGRRLFREDAAQPLSITKFTGRDRRRTNVVSDEDEHRRRQLCRAGSVARRGWPGTPGPGTRTTLRAPYDGWASAARQSSTRKTVGERQSSPRCPCRPSAGAHPSEAASRASRGARIANERATMEGESLSGPSQSATGIVRDYQRFERPGLFLAKSVGNKQRLRACADCQPPAYP